MWHNVCNMLNTSNSKHTAISLRHPYRLLQGLQNKSHHKSAPARETWGYQNCMLQLKVGNVGLELHGPLLHFTDRN
jgi:hypothetical protein